MDEKLLKVLHLHIGSMVRYKRFNEELQMYTVIKPRELNVDCLLTINMLYGEHSLIDVQLFLRPLNDMSAEEAYEFNNIGTVIFKDKQDVSQVQDAEGVRYLLSKHFDLFGLIEAGFAIDIKMNEIRKYSRDEIKQMAKDFVDKNLPKWECECSACGATNCKSNKTCINCNCQL